MKLHKYHDKLSIVIPTKDRPDFLKRQLNYYAQQKLPYTIYIGDSSDEQQFLENQKNISTFSDQLKIVYKDFRGVRLDPTLYQLISFVKTPYLVFVGDDDLLIPTALSKAIEFLDEHPDYGMVSGDRIQLFTSNQEAHTKILNINFVIAGQDESNSAAERLWNMVSNFWDPIFSVMRKEVLYNALKASIEIEKNQEVFSFTQYTLCAIQSKYKKIKGLAMVFNSHESGRPLKVYDGFMSPDGLSNLLKTHEIFTEYLMKIDGLSKDKASEASHQAWLRYIEIFARKKLLLPSKRTLLGKIYKVLTQFTGELPFKSYLVKKRAYFLKSIKEFRSSSLSEKSLYDKYETFESLLDPTSPYSEVLLPIYELYQNTEIHDLD
jgi:glycosyltransferase domain-containing protein